MKNKISFNSPPLSEYVAKTQPYRAVPRRALWGLCIFSFVLMAAPKARLAAAGIPIYLIDGLVVFLWFMAFRQPRQNRGQLKPIVLTVCFYLISVCLSELYGMIEYKTTAQSLYMLGRFGLAISLVFTLPKLLNNTDDVLLILKWLSVGLLIASAITIMYSWPPTRALTLKILSIDFLNPGSASIAGKSFAEGGMRGRSMVGAATMTAGFLGVAWPLSLIVSKLRRTGFWTKLTFLLVSVAAPLAILMTYGRTAWLIVLILGTLISFFGLAGGRRNVAILVIVCVVYLFQYGLESKNLMMSRIVKATKIAIEKPTEDVSTSERFLSYIGPFEHVTDNPSWLVLGPGLAGVKVARRGDEGISELVSFDDVANHSAFSMAYYAFGMPAAICQLLLMVFAFRLILRRAKLRAKLGADLQLIWQSLLMSWCALSIWWLSGHAMVGEPRGAMLFFFMYGLLWTAEKFTMAHFANQNNPCSH